jgi:hypothetical protein
MGHLPACNRSQPPRSRRAACCQSSPVAQAGEIRRDDRRKACNMTARTSIKSSIALALALCVTGATTASAMPYREPNRSHGEVAPKVGQQSSRKDTPVAGDGLGLLRGGLRPGNAYRPGVAGALIAPTAKPSSGDFDWGDAAIGAAAVLAVGIIGFGAATTLSSRREPVERAYGSSGNVSGS